jgi:hypothetical protein
MKYISLDTCVWVSMIGGDTDIEPIDIPFDEICWLIEEGHFKHLAPENVIREWDNNKTKNQVRVNKVGRVDRADNILKNLSIIARENDNIYLEAGKRNSARLVRYVNLAARFKNVVERKAQSK